MNFIDNNPEGDVEDDIFEHECWWEQRVIQNDKMICGRGEGIL